jgi:hypothetical protein
MPVLGDLELRQRNRGSEHRQPELLGQARRDILRYRCNTVGPRRNNCSGYETRQTKQNALWCDFGFQRVLDHMMGGVPDI